MGGSFSALLAGGGALANALEKQDDEALKEVLVSPLSAHQVDIHELPIAVLYWCIRQQRGCSLQSRVIHYLSWNQCF